jgi:hypothetical protein
MYSPSDLDIKENMVICCAHPRRSWSFILEPTMGMMHVRSGNVRSNWCCKSHPGSVLTRHAVRETAGINSVTKMVTSLEKQLTVIEAKLLLTPKDLNLMKSQMEVNQK